MTELLGGAGVHSFAKTLSLRGRALLLVTVRRQRRWLTAMTREHPDEPDLIADIRVDHDEMRRYFDMYKKSTGDDAHKWFNQFVWEVCRHSAAEEVVMYPMLDTMGEEGRKLAEKSRADHLHVKEQLVAAQKENDPNKFNAIFDDLFKTLTDHMKFEEGPGGDLEWIENFSTPKDRKWASRRFRAAKAIAPTEPHPSVPMKPAILEQGLALLTAPFDKLKDFFKEFPSEEEMRQAQP